MIFFYYGFGMALGIALGVAIGNAWVREHRVGIWDRKTAWSVAGVSIAFGLVAGWALQQYLTLVFLSQTTRQ